MRCTVLNSCITVLSVLIIKIFQGCASPLALIKDEKIVKNQGNGLKVPLFDFSKCHVQMPKSHWFLRIYSYNRHPNIQSHKAEDTYAQPLTYELFFQNNSIMYSSFPTSMSWYNYWYWTWLTHWRHLRHYDVICCSKHKLSTILTANVANLVRLTC